MKKYKLILKILFSFVILLSVLQIVVSNQLATTGIALGKIDDALKVYKEENEIIREKLLISSSLFQIASKAASLGFVEKKSQVVFIGSLPLAIKQ